MPFLKKLSNKKITQKPKPQMFHHLIIFPQSYEILLIRAKILFELPFVHSDFILLQITPWKDWSIKNSQNKQMLLHNFALICLFLGWWAKIFSKNFYICWLLEYWIKWVIMVSPYKLVKCNVIQDMANSLEFEIWYIGASEFWN